MAKTLKEIAEILGAELEGDPRREISGLAPIEEAVEGELTFLANKKYQKYLATTRASAVIAAPHTEVPTGRLAALRLEDPYLGFVKVLRIFHPWERYAPPGIHDSSVVHPSAVLGEQVTVGASAVIGRNVRIGARSVIAEGVVVCDDVIIGEDCLVYPNVSVLSGTQIGSRVIIHAGTTLGSDGFGFAPHDGMYEKIPQVGHVIVEDDVEIGANCAIDRGTIGPTLIRNGAKLDNLIQIAHNVDVGEHTVIAAQTGVSGSTVLGHHVVLAGQVGLVGHIEIGDRVTVGAQAGVSKDLGGEGTIYRGSPAREIHEELRLEAALRHLPDLIRTVRRQETRIAELEEALKEAIEQRSE